METNRPGLNNFKGLGIKDSEPSITTWTRIEPRPRDAELSKSLQAQVRDPTWFLARQWQLGEFMGEDAGSPVQATISVTNRTLSTFTPGDSDSSIPFDTVLPLEVHVERQPILLKLRLTIQLGLWVEQRLKEKGAPDAISVLRETYPIQKPNGDDADIYDGEAGSMIRQLATGRVVNGSSLYLAAIGNTTVPPLPSVTTTDPIVASVMADFVTYRNSLYSEPENDSAWQTSKLSYDFSVSSETENDSIKLVSDGFGGGHLDWYNFKLSSSAATSAESQKARVSESSYNFLPQHVVFRGMPEPRWWEIEEGKMDFGSLDTEPVDLAKMLVMEFALTFGNDWFIIPLPTDVGSLSTVTGLVVTDTFGERTLIRSAEQTTVNPGESPWSMFKISGKGVRSPFVMMPPSLGATDEGAPLETVKFLRDDMAAMAWAVEHELHGTLDSPIDAYQSYLFRLAQHPLTPPVRSAGDPPIFYTLQSTVPDNWIPFIPVQTGSGDLYFRRGQMVTPDKTISAHASILEPGKAFFLTDRIITHIGTIATTSFRRSRGIDGKTYVWQSRRSKPGTGPGWSGLRFDYLSSFNTNNENTPT